MTSYARLHLGTAPDSWGIWFPDDPKQPHWSTFLDEVVESGFRTIELGPFGYLPTHPEQLKDEVGKRGLTLTGGTVGTATHRGADASRRAVAMRSRSANCSPRWTYTTWWRYRRCTPTCTRVRSPSLRN